MKKLGFGCMRLPLNNKDDQTNVDVESFSKLVDTFLDNGFTYFDTALAYHGFKSEEFVKEALVKRHPRDAFQLATKLPPRMIKAEEDHEKMFVEQLEKCGVEFFDYYLLHNIGVSAYQQACQYNSFDFLRKLKEGGRVKTIGFSFHDTAELLEQILSEQPGLDFVQLQLNYIDWENPGIQARQCYEVARKYNLPIIVMEPCKGGNLASVPEEAEKLMKEYRPDSSIPSWAFRFVASQEGVMMVLSGMNTMEMLNDNMSVFDNFQPLNKEEYQVINKVTNILNANIAIPCTTCRYCVEKCPQDIPIPDYFALYNSTKQAVTSNISSQFVYYTNLATNHGKASDCIACRECEDACPQHIQIADFMKDIEETYEKNGPTLPSR